ncbi:hypothetical protein T07_13308 [Trichinella nelsoni]|uniref:Uncharacterized protein n=1 Tax=Trichinella nelsoni TaxID=6336 RepID=A0A0V0RYU4_9BILA|nr:hypothetical protein T07_13308 [Trichinella nelsoni]
MLLTVILVVIFLALIYHFVTQKKQITDWKETQDQRMTAIPEKKTPEEIIKESEEQQLKAEKKQVGKTKKKTTSKKSKKAIKSTPKGTDISKEKTETDKKIEMAECSPETISAVAAKRNLIPQIVPKVATEKKAAERIEEEESRKEKKKSKKKSKSHKSKKGETEKKSKKQSKSKKSKKTVEDTVANNAVCSQMVETDITSPKLTLAGEITAMDIDQPNIVPPIAEEKVEKPLIKGEQKDEKKDSKKIKKKSKKRSKSKKTKKSDDDRVAGKAVSSQIAKTDIKSPKRIFPTETKKK